MQEQEVVLFLKDCSRKGWMPGTSGGLAHLSILGLNSKKMLVTPEGFNKDSFTVSDFFTLRDLYGSQELIAPIAKKGEPVPIMSKWTALFIEVLGRFPNATVVAELATKWANLASRTAFKMWQKNAESFPGVLRVAHWGLLWHLGNSSELLVPIIDGDTPEELHRSLQNALTNYPSTNIVLIRNYGLLVWGENINDLKNKIESIEHLCELQVLDFHLLK